MAVKITYNSPVILTFTIVSFVIMLISVGIHDLTPYLALDAGFDWASADYYRLLTYTCVHAFKDFKMQTDFSHFISNFTIILLIGPVLEEKFGSKKILLMMVFTAVVTGLLNTVFFSNGIIGASGVALMMVILGSFTNYSKGDLPLTFIFISLLFLGNELVSSFSSQQISHFAHVMGGITGGIFGFRYAR